MHREIQQRDRGDRELEWGEKSKITFPHGDADAAPESDIIVPWLHCPFGGRSGERSQSQPHLDCTNTQQMRPARSPPRKRPPPSGEAPPAELSLTDAVRLVVCLVAMAFVRLSSFRIFHGGARVSASQLLSIPEWVGKTFPCVNKHVQREYRVRNAGDMMTVRQVWNSDRYYLQAGVNADTGIEANQLLTTLMAQHKIIRIAVWVLQMFFTIETVSVWINGRGLATTETHYDSDHNLVIVLHGLCVFYTAPRRAFSPGGEGCRPNESNNSPLNSDFFTAHSMSTGTMALQPADMWHYVESSGHCVKVAIFFK
jgi:hypothetical protein